MDESSEIFCSWGVLDQEEISGKCPVRQPFNLFLKKISARPPINLDLACLIFIVD